MMVKNKSIVKLFFWLFFSFFIPSFIGSVLTYFHEKDMRQRDLVAKIQDLTQNLRVCLSEPMASFAAQEALRVAQLIVLDESIVEVFAYSDTYEMTLVHIDILERHQGQLLSSEEAVLFEGVPIGRVRVTASTHLIRGSILSPFLLKIYLTFLGACVFGFLIMGIMFQKIVGKPMRRLLSQARRINEGKMTEPFLWEGDDEFSSLGQTIEEMRKKLLSRFRKMYSEARTDTLTGISNRLGFSEKILLVMEDCYEKNQPFSLIMFDLDDFKKVNDTYGHSVGDVVLNVISLLLQDNIRHNDLFARWGGEEFLIALSGVNKSQALQLAEKLRKMIANATYPMGISMTASLGLVQAEYGESFAFLLERADEAMYLAKKRGKNQVVFIDIDEKGVENPDSKQAYQA